jgi:hypothetical protein
MFKEAAGQKLAIGLPGTGHSWTSSESFLPGFALPPEFDS